MIDLNKFNGEDDWKLIEIKNYFKNSSTLCKFTLSKA